MLSPMVLRPGRRLCAIEVTPEFFAGMCVEGHELRFKVIAGAPAGARVAWARYDLPRNVFVIVLEHDSFDVVPESEFYPTLAVEFAALA